MNLALPFLSPACRYPRKPSGPFLALALALGLGGCQSGTGDSAAGDSGPGVGGSLAQRERAIGITPSETVSLIGTEPFWGGMVEGDRLVYTTPDNPKGIPLPVRRFTGNNGLGFSGTLEGVPLDLAITRAPCTDGMSDRRYPYTAILQLGGETRNGCASTARNPATGP